MIRPNTVCLLSNRREIATALLLGFVVAPLGPGPGHLTPLQPPRSMDALTKLLRRYAP